MAVTTDVHRESIGSMLGYSNWNEVVESFDSSCLLVYGVEAASFGCCFRSYKGIGSDRKGLELWSLGC
jgi:hypothetical protein